MTVVINGTTGITSVNGSAAAPSVTGTDTDTGIVYGTNTLSLATGGTSGLTMDSSQNVIIGASATDSGAKTRVVFGATQNGIQIKDSNDTSGAAFLIFQNGSNSNFATIARDGTNNSLSIGTVSAITFPATQVASAGANTLDDYEEGTWTPTFAAGTWTYTNQVGKYTKIGNLVICSCIIDWSSSSGTADAFGIRLPINTGGLSTDRYCGSMGYLSGIDTAGCVQVNLTANGGGQAAAYVYGVNDNAAPTSILNSGISSSGEFQMTICYQV